MANVRHSPSVTLYFTHASSSLSPLSLLFRSNFFFSSERAPRGAHLLRARGQLFISNSRAGPRQKERGEARAGRRQWRGQSNNFGSAERVRGEEGDEEGRFEEN